MGSCNKKLMGLVDPVTQCGKRTQCLSASQLWHLQRVLCPKADCHHSSGMATTSCIRPGLSSTATARRKQTACPSISSKSKTHPDSTYLGLCFTLELMIAANQPGAVPSARVGSATSEAQSYVKKLIHE